MNYYYLYPEVTLLLLNDTEDKEKILYASNNKSWPMPKIGSRPPYYKDPVYEKHYPII